MTVLAKMLLALATVTTVAAQAQEDGFIGDFEDFTDPVEAQGFPIDTNPPTRIRCESEGYKLKKCDVRGSIVSVALVQRLSKSKCREDVSWGYERRAVWVKDGCRAILEVTTQPNPGQDVLCESHGRQYKTCDAPYLLSGVVLKNRKSTTRCIEGENWGYSSRSIWVDAGCRAIFWAW